MPTLRTPLRPPARPNARSQFASTPRFLLSQRAVAPRNGARGDDSILSEDDAELFPVRTPRPANTTRARDRTAPRKDVIEDSGSEPDKEREQYEVPAVNVAGTGDVDETTSSPPLDTTELDAELEALFGAPRRTKRRRVSASTATPVPQKRKLRDDLIISSSSAPSPSAVDPPSPSLPSRTAYQTRAAAPTPRKTPQFPTTPATARPFVRNYPRFLNSPAPSQPPPNTQPLPRIRPLTSTPRSTSPPPRRKPTFVLPRSPSPSQSHDPTTIPTPFSPSSHALRRRGRSRSSAPSYLQGGMAAEVRSWILEMGTKREQLHASLGGRAGPNPSTDLQRYSLVLRITEVHQSALGSCGPLAFVQGQAVEAHDGPSNDREDSQSTRNVLLLGAPRLQTSGRPLLHKTPSNTRVPGLQRGDVVGVCRGLVWELGGEEHRSIDGRHELDFEQILRGENKCNPKLGNWLIAMEWELISSG